jgi:hypothetical protein
MNLSARYRYLRFAALTYFLLLSGFNFFGTLLNLGFKWSDFVLLVLCCLPLVFRKRFVYYSFGTIALLLSLYMMLALYSDYIDYAEGKQMSQPLVYFGVGSLFFVTGAAFSIIMICVGTTLTGSNGSALSPIMPSDVST